MSTSTSEAEYITLRHVAKEAVWIRCFVNKMNLEFVEDITLHSNNEMSITLIKNVESQYRTKWINI